MLTRDRGKGGGGEIYNYRGQIVHVFAHSVGYGGSGKSTELQVNAASVTEAMKGPR